LKNVDKKHIEIHAIFNQDKKDYILFSIDEHERDYLYINSNERKLRSFLFGKDLKTFIDSSLKGSKSGCIECQLGYRIEGGVSLDGEDMIESILNVQSCNAVLKDLKDVLGDKSHLIELF